MINRTVLVTGGAGFVGSHTCKALACAGFVPVTYDNLSNGKSEFVKWGPLERGDLEDKRRLRDVLERHSPVAVLHFAASIEAGESVKSPEKFYRNNVVGTLSLLEEMLRVQLRLIVFSSTAAVYGQPLSSPIPESQQACPTNPYGSTKAFIEKLLADFSLAHTFRYCALRYFNAAGADPQSDLVEGHLPESHLIPLAIRAAVEPNAEFRIFGRDYPTPDGTCIRDYIHVSDLADAHVHALQRLLRGGSVLTANLGTGIGHSVLEVMHEIETSMGRPIRLIFSDRRPGDPAILVADPSLARRELGWSPQYPHLRTQIEHAITSMKKHSIIS